MGTDDIVFSVSHLSASYVTGNLYGKKQAHEVLHDINFAVRRGEILGLVGESGSGKSTLARVMLGLQKYSSGSVLCRAANPQMVFQNPYGALNPAWTIERIMEEPLRIAKKYPRVEFRDRVKNMVETVELPQECLSAYPGELSGGQRQRVCIAVCLLREPELLICDEPVSALDVSVQKQILNLLIRLRDTVGISYFFISHDLNVIGQICDRVLVMKSGHIIESGICAEVFAFPKESYTKELIKAARVELDEAN